MPCCKVFACMPLGFFPGLYCSLIGVMAAKTKQSVVYADRRIIPISFFAVSDTFMFVSISVGFFTFSRFPLTIHRLMPCQKFFVNTLLGFFPGLYCFLIGFIAAKSN